jgi:hypothetical protein
MVPPQKHRDACETLCGFVCSRRVTKGFRGPVDQATSNSRKQVPWHRKGLLKSHAWHLHLPHRAESLRSTSTTVYDTCFPPPVNAQHAFSAGAADSHKQFFSTSMSSRSSSHRRGSANNKRNSYKAAAAAQGLHALQSRQREILYLGVRILPPSSNPIPQKRTERKAT